MIKSSLFKGVLMKLINKKPPEEFNKKKILYGAASLTQVVSGIEFPKTKTEILNKYGKKTLHYSKSNIKTIKEVLEKSPQENFSTMSEFVEACSKRN